MQSKNIIATSLLLAGAFAFSPACHAGTILDFNWDGPQLGEQSLTVDLASYEVEQVHYIHGQTEGVNYSLWSPTEMSPNIIELDGDFIWMSGLDASGSLYALNLDFSPGTEFALGHTYSFSGNESVIAGDIFQDISGTMQVSDIDRSVTKTPEPGSAILLGSALLLAGLVGRRRRHS